MAMEQIKRVKDSVDGLREEMDTKINEVKEDCERMMDDKIEELKQGEQEAENWWCRCCCGGGFEGQAWFQHGAEGIERGLGPSSRTLSTFEQLDAKCDAALLLAVAAGTAKMSSGRCKRWCATQMRRCTRRARRGLQRGG